MSVASPDGDLVPPRRQSRRVLIGALQHLTVERLNGGEVILEPFKVFELAPSGHAGKHVIDAEEKAALG